MTDIPDQASEPEGGSRGLVLGTDGLSEEQLRSHRLALKIVVPLAILLAVLVAVFFVFYDFSRVDGPSMLPTLHGGDYLLITKGLGTPQRGEIVVINGYGGPGAAELVKRVVGLPGDNVKVVGDRAWVNGASSELGRKVELSDTPYPAGDLVVPPGKVWVMGDNRPVSFDSRMMGPLPLSAIHGKVIAIWAPLTRIGLVPSP